MRTLFIFGLLLLMVLVIVTPAMSAREGHFTGSHFHHFGHPRFFIGGFPGYPYYAYPYWYYPYPYGYPAYPPPDGYPESGAYPQPPPASSTPDQSGSAAPGQGF